MSVSFTAPDLQPTFQALVDGTADYDWALFNQAGNELKVQATGNGLEDLSEEFLDGRIQYAFARVKDPSRSLDRSVLIAWCGEGVPESRKGLFHTNLSQVQSKFLKGAHLVIQARSDLDVTPEHIAKRIQESSGSKYSSGSAVPVANRAPAAAKPAVPSFRPSQGLGGSQGVVSDGVPSAAAPPPASSFSRPTPAASAPPPPPAATRPTPAPPAPAPAPAPVAAAPPPAPPRPVVSASTPSAPAADSSKPAYEDRIAPVGTNYEPVKLAAPGKLANRWNPGGNRADDDEGSAAPAVSIKDRMAAFSNAPAQAASVPQPSGKKLTWSERQAAAKKQAEEEEAASAAASAAELPTSPSPLTPHSRLSTLTRFSYRQQGIVLAPIVRLCCCPSPSPGPGLHAARGRCLGSATPASSCSALGSPCGFSRHPSSSCRLGRREGGRRQLGCSCSPSPGPFQAACPRA
ncbi:hypothetical protein VHUM_00832 [Vanrija humicola]|uniref:ADF-H domain-containing protein n=1 Tax=Vanrija humicola TaxID=5417 RepID=A0A7D8V1T7_VANHU|nr:hypothetical protein VHUM_00832 [Vanrija humicola]